jgi:RNA ligase (TIGR02306 family)
MILPLGDVEDYINKKWAGDAEQILTEIQIGKLLGRGEADLTEVLGILKWEKEVPAQLAGLCKGNFPNFIPKTDQERCQNLKKEIFEVNRKKHYEVTVKLDGSSMTVYRRQDPDGELEVGVCSRNLNLKLDQEGNSFVDTANNTLLLPFLKTLNVGNIAIQGELMGVGIQKNRENLPDIQFFVYDIFDIDKQKYLTPVERTSIVDKLIRAGVNIKHVPVLYASATLDDLGIVDIQGLLKFAEGASLNNPVREGLVFKAIDGSFSFKSISNLFLEKGGD